MTVSLDCVITATYTKKLVKHFQNLNSLENKLVKWCHDNQQNDFKHKGLFITLSIDDTQHRWYPA